MLRLLPSSPPTGSAWGSFSGGFTPLSAGTPHSCPFRKEQGGARVDSPRAGGARSRSRRAAGGRWDGRAEPAAAGGAWDPGAWGRRVSAGALQLAVLQLQTCQIDASLPFGPLTLTKDKHLSTQVPE